jgi:hypothetical protein
MSDQLHLQRASTVGFHYRDEHGVAWSTLHCVNHTAKCEQCGTEFERGYTGGYMTEPRYRCSNCVAVQN